MPALENAGYASKNSIWSWQALSCAECSTWAVTMVCAQMVMKGAQMDLRPLLHNGWLYWEALRPSMPSSSCGRYQIC
jgi:hypothetical protein